ncbi:MAG: molybdate ABC transporter substrate-binding protein [Pseudomonadota bacterium]
MHLVLLIIAALLSALPAGAADLRVAVAANFRPVLEELAPLFHDETSHRVLISAGSTGQLAAQIQQGAPFDVLLAADSATPARLVATGDAVPETREIYAEGALVLIGADTADAADADPRTVLQAARRIALANPRTAPYGMAARAYLEQAGLWTQLENRLVLGRNAAGAFAAVASGAADAGLVALSSALAGDVSYLTLPPDQAPPIRQEAVMLRPGSANPASALFLAFLSSPQARTIIQRFGYDVL